MEWISVKDERPETNTAIIIYLIDDKGKGHTIKAVYIEGKTLAASIDSEWYEYDETTDSYYCPEGWFEDVYAETGLDYNYHWLGTDSELNITHWQRLKNPR